VSLTDRDKKIVLALVPLLLIGAYWFMLLSPKRHEAAKLSGQVTKAQEARDAAVSQANQLTQARAKFATEYAEMVRLGKALPTRVDMPSLIVQLSSAAAGTHIQFGTISVGQRVSATPPPPITLPGTGSGSGSATVFGADVAKARAAHAAETNSAAQSSAASNSVGTTGATGPSGSSSTSSSATSNAPGLDEVPLTFKFGGQFNDLADFFHRLKRFVHIANRKINVDGRLITIDSLTFTSTQFPSLEADVTATVYLTPKTEGPTAGATPSGPQAEQTAAIAAVQPAPSGGGTQ
jgi:Tfp pilus assembly protein PilO